MSAVFPESPPSSPPATATPGQAAYEAHAAMVVPRPWRWDQLDGKLRAAWEAAAQAAIVAQAAPELAAAMAETAYVRDIAGTLIGLFRDSRSDGWRARTSGARLKRLAHEAGLPAPDPARRENQALTAYEELDGAHAAALETVDALDADNARLAAECAALTGQLAVMTAARDDLARELDAALTTVSRWQDENQRLIEERDAAQGRERMATMALAEEITELRAHRDQLRRERDEAVNRAAEVGDERNRFGAALALIADPETRREGDPSDEEVAREALEGRPWLT